MKGVIGNLLGLCGVGLMAYGVWTRWPWAGFVVGGVFLFAVGMAMVIEAQRER